MGRTLNYTANGARGYGVGLEDNPIQVRPRLFRIVEADDIVPRTQRDQNAVGAVRAAPPRVLAIQFPARVSVDGHDERPFVVRYEVDFHLIQTVTRRMHAIEGDAAGVLPAKVRDDLAAGSLGARAHVGAVGKDGGFRFVTGLRESHPGRGVQPKQGDEPKTEFKSFHAFF